MDTGLILRGCNVINATHLAADSGEIGLVLDELEQMSFKNQIVENALCETNFKHICALTISPSMDIAKNACAHRKSLPLAALQSQSTFLANLPVKQAILYI